MYKLIYYRPSWTGCRDRYCTLSYLKNVIRYLDGESFEVGTSEYIKDEIRRDFSEYYCRDLTISIIDNEVRFNMAKRYKNALEKVDTYVKNYVSLHGTKIDPFWLSKEVAISYSYIRKLINNNLYLKDYITTNKS